MPRVDPLATPVREALHDFSESLSKVRLGVERDAMFPSGHAALALGHSALERVLPGRGHGEKASSELDLGIKSLSRGTFAPVLYGGFAGFAWATTYIDGRDASANADEDDACASVDEALVDFLSTKKWRQTYDLVGGLVGYGVYALERLARPAAVTMLERIVDHLAATAVPTQPGLSWRTVPAWVPAAVRTSAHRGFNVGLAHGVPGILALLGRVVRAGVAKREAARLLEGGAAWLLAQEAPAPSPAAFGYSVTRAKFEPSRAAWCYGDPGVAGALLVAAQASGDKALERAAIRIGLRAVARDPETSGVVDAALCHGTAGLAHIFLRLHTQTGDARFLAASRTWIGRTLAQRTTGPRRRGVGGFQTFGPPPSTNVSVWRTDASFLTGSVGIAMALAAYASLGDGPDWAGWDRVLLLSDTPDKPAKSRSRAPRRA